MKMKRFQLYFAIITIGLLIFGSIFAPFLATDNPFEPNMLYRLQGPSLEHFFGTDALGRDMYSRILYGGRVSMLLALVSALLALAIGVFIGIISGFYGGKVDLFFLLLSNIFQGIPSSCFMIAVAGILGTSIYSLVTALVITSWAAFSRIVRAEVLQLIREPFVEGLRCLGCSNSRIIFKHLLPNISNKLMVLFTIRIGKAILSIAGLSFLGLGVQPPVPDWSVMINDAVMYYRSAPHLIIVPGFFVFILIYSLNIIGEYLRDKFDVRFEEVRKW
ncbi:MAG: ABC transporter permease [Phascolarctobacterium sp.]